MVIGHSPASGHGRRRPDIMRAGVIMASRTSPAGGGLEYERVLDRVASGVPAVLGGGRVPGGIPVLASADPDTFGLAVATAEGEVYGVGEWRRRFSIQSISKVFTLALVIEKDGEAIWARVGREPSGTAFNSLVQLEYEHGIPRNPFINAGALVVTDRLLTLTADACGAVERFLRTECACPEIASDQVVASSEAGPGVPDTRCSVRSDQTRTGRPPGAADPRSPARQPASARRRPCHRPSRSHPGPGRRPRTDRPGPERRRGPPTAHRGPRPAGSAGTNGQSPRLPIGRTR